MVSAENQNLPKIQRQNIFSLIIRLRALAGGEHNQNTPISTESHFNHGQIKDSSANCSEPGRKKIRYCYGREELLSLFEKMKPRLKEFYTTHGLNRDRSFPSTSNPSQESLWSRPMNSEALARLNRLDRYFRIVKLEFANAERDRFEKNPLER